MPRNSPIAKIQLLIEYVERNIKKPLSLDEISGQAGLSKYHLNRIFRAMTGRQLMDYVRNRKLSRSVLDLLDADYKVIDVAMEYGFAYEQSYIRAFGRAFGMSPDRFRKERAEIRVTDKLDLGLLEAVGEDGMIVEPAIRLRPAFSIVGERHEMNVGAGSDSRAANRLGNDFFYNRRGLVTDAKDPGTYIGFMALFPDEPDRVSYMPSVMVSSPPGVPCALPECMTRLEVPANKYAVFTYIGFHHPRYVAVDEYEHIYEYIYGSWLPASPYRLKADYRFESIDDEVEREDYCEVELYIPIEDGERGSGVEGSSAGVV
jgi:AraC family transcriptional regulator